MARTSVFPLLDRLLDGQLESKLREHRATGASFETIARALSRDYDIDLSGATVRRWCEDLGMDTGRQATS